MCHSLAKTAWGKVQPDSTVPVNDVAVALTWTRLTACTPKLVFLVCLSEDLCVCMHEYKPLKDDRCGWRDGSAVKGSQPKLKKMIFELTTTALLCRDCCLSACVFSLACSLTVYKNL